MLLNFDFKSAFKSIFLQSFCAPTFRKQAKNPYGGKGGVNETSTGDYNMSFGNQISLFQPVAPGENMFPDTVYLNVDFKTNKNKLKS